MTLKHESEIATLQELVHICKEKVYQLLQQLQTQEEDKRNAVNQAEEMKLKLHRSECEKAHLAEEVCNILQRLEKSNMSKSDALQKLTKKEKHVADIQRDLQRANEQAITLKTKYDLLAQKYGEEAYPPVIHYTGRDTTPNFNARTVAQGGKPVQIINILNT